MSTVASGAKDFDKNWTACGSHSGSAHNGNPLQGHMLGSSAAFVSELDTSGTTAAPLLFSTYVTGFGADHGNGVAVDGSGAVDVAGYTTSPFFPTGHAVQGMPQGHEDAFVMRLAQGAPPRPVLATLNTNRGYTDRPTILVLKGSNFIGATAVLFGSVPAAVFRVESDSLIRLSTPAHPAGSVDVTVVGPGGRSACSSATHFLFVAPPPNAGPAPLPCQFLLGPGLEQPTPAPTGSAVPRACQDIPLVPDVAVSPGGLSLPPAPVLGALAAFFLLVVAGAVVYSVRGRG